jgi:hypothetical protein
MSRLPSHARLQSDRLVSRVLPTAEPEVRGASGAVPVRSGSRSGSCAGVRGALSVRRSGARGSGVGRPRAGPCGVAGVRRSGVRDRVRDLIELLKIEL